MRKIELGSTDIFLENYKTGQGKITISSGDNGAFTFYWGAMGSNIEEFIQNTNSDYFATKLSTHPDEFDSKLSIRNVRKYIREELSFELPWYRYLEGQKALRERLKEIEQGAFNEQHFVNLMESFTDNLFTELDISEEKEFFEILRNSIECEPWHFIHKSESSQFKWLKSIHEELKRFLQSENKKAS